MSEATGRAERRSTGWSTKEVIQGKPIRRPTHPFFVIFPISFWVGALGVDILGRLHLLGAPLAATYAVAAGLIGAVFAITTGLVDRSQMRPGSRIRAVATRHMTIQLAATAIFVADLAVRWGDRHSTHVSVLWLVLDVLGTATVILGGDVGAQMVFRMGYRVGETAEPSEHVAPPSTSPLPGTAEPGGV
jgi:uncharacterized membrane protein